MALAWEHSVYSSNVQSVGYDADAGEMIVTWKNGKRSAYSGVSEQLADDVSKAPSVGQALNQQIKPYYEHRYI